MKREKLIQKAMAGKVISDSDVLLLKVIEERESILAEAKERLEENADLEEKRREHDAEVDGMRRLLVKMKASAEKYEENGREREVAVRPFAMDEIAIREEWISDRIEFSKRFHAFAGFPLDVRSPKTKLLIDELNLGEFWDEVQFDLRQIPPSPRAKQLLYDLRTQPDV